MQGKLVALVLVSLGAWVYEARALGQSPVAQTLFWDQKLQFDSRIFADKNGSPMVSTAQARIVSKDRVVEEGSGKTLCKGQTCVDFLDLIVSQSDPQVAIYLFKKHTINGQVFAQIRYGKTWAWVKLRGEDPVTMLQKDEVLCYQEQKRKQHSGESRAIEAGDVGPGKLSRLESKARDGKAMWDFRLTAPGMIAVQARAPVLATVRPLFAASQELPRVAQPLESGKSMLILALPGRYRLTLEEPLEGDALPSCPSIILAAELKVLPPSPQALLEGVAKQAREPQPIPWVQSTEARSYRTILSWLHPKVSFVAPSEAAFVRLSLPKPLSPGVRLSADRFNRELKGQGPWWLLAASDGEDSVSLELTEPVSTDTAVEVLLSAAYLPLESGDKKLFSLADTQIQSIGLGDALSLRFKVRNNSGFDLSDLKIFVRPSPNASTPSEFQPTRPWDTVRQPSGTMPGMHYTGWLENISVWKKGEIRTFDYGTVIPRTTTAETYGVLFELVSLQQQPIRPSFAYSYFDLVKVLALVCFAALF